MRRGVIGLSSFALALVVSMSAYASSITVAGNVTSINGDPKFFHIGGHYIVTTDFVGGITWTVDQWEGFDAGTIGPWFDDPYCSGSCPSLNLGPTPREIQATGDANSFHLKATSTMVDNVAQVTRHAEWDIDLVGGGPYTPPPKELKEPISLASIHSAMLKITYSGPGAGSFQDTQINFDVTYGFVQYIYPTPIPAALPLFASSLAGLGLMAWRRRGAA